MIKLIRKIEIIRDENCTGCSACYNICPTESITIKEDQRGSYKPYINKDKCIDCGKCDNVCPILQKHEAKNNYMKSLYAAWASDEIRMVSSSGGAFTVFADYVIDNYGVVFGAAWGENFRVKHNWVDNKHDLFKLQKSKYLQSYIGIAFKQVEDYLRQGRHVMFVGTPCQIVGLKNYLFKKRINDDLLITLDLYCHNSPPYRVFQRFIDDNFGYDLQAFNFRLKDGTYCCHKFSYRLRGGEIKQVKEMTSYFKGYFPLLYMPKHCENCSFQGDSRPGDISIGDFWEVEKHQANWNDGKGTSMILVNTEKGAKFFEQVSNRFMRVEQVPLSWIRAGQGEKSKAHPNRDYLYKLLDAKVNFNKAVELALAGKKFDIGLVCVLVYCNYGSGLTNYALYSLLKKYNKSVLIINQPNSSIIKPNNPQYFKYDPFLKEDRAGYFANNDQMKVLNTVCKKFLVGSDQLFNENIYKQIDGFVKLDWVDNGVPKVSYATSFGINKLFGNNEERLDFRRCLRRFDSVSLRESWGVPLVMDKFGIIADHVLDPVFLCDLSVWEKLIENEQLEKTDYLFAYILDPDAQKEVFLNNCIRSTGLSSCVTSDRARNKDDVSCLWGVEMTFPNFNESWLALLYKSSFIVADSFHALSFALIFHKPFIVLKSKRRGNDRVLDLLELVGLSNRILDDDTSAEQIDKIVKETIDWDMVNAALDQEKQKSVKWFEKYVINDISF